MVIILMLIFCIVLSLFVKYVDDKYKKSEIEKVTEINERNRKYKEKNNIPENANLLCCTNITVKDMLIDGNWNVFVWKDNNTFNFCGTSKNNGIKNTTISMEDIQFYTRKGDYRVETFTKGGGSSFGRGIIIGLISAFIGYMIGEFIDAINFRIFTSSGLSSVLAIILFVLGVLLGGRNKTITKNKEIDNRKTYFNYLENNENKQMIFISKDYDTLLKLIPEKEMSYIENNKIVASNNFKNHNDSIYKDIEKLAELRDKGILTEDEFNHKKQVLLEKIE